MLKISRSPYGYKNLLAYQKAEELQAECGTLTAAFPREKTLIALADQMDRSARSTKQNVVEGWRRNSTGEYYQFLGFAIGSNAELEEDCDDIWKGRYPKLMGVKGVMGEKGVKGEIGDVEKLRFYPLDKTLPPIVQLKLRAKEVNFLLEQLQKALAQKMTEEHRLSGADKLARSRDRRKREAQEFEALLVKHGMTRLPDGTIVSKGKEGV